MFEFSFVGIAGGGASPITASSNWGASHGAAGADITSNTRTLSVLGGNPGSLDFNITAANTTGGTLRYSKNGGAFATLSDDQDITFAHNDTLAFRIDDPVAPGGECGLTVTDNTFKNAVGSWLCSVDEL